MMLFLDCVLSSNPNILMMQPKALQREVGYNSSFIYRILYIEFDSILDNLNMLFLDCVLSSNPNILMMQPT